MKSITTFIVSILFAFTSICISSCKGDELSRSTAEKAIKAKLQNVEIRPFFLFGNDFNYPKLQEAGLITYYRDYANMVAKITEKGKQFAVSEVYTCNYMPDGYSMYPPAIDVRVANLSFGQITGILQNKQSNTAEVDYTIIRKDVTPFGILDFGLNEGTYNESVTFTKYDDGWRINK